MEERVLYDSETAKWYKQGDKGGPFRPFQSSVADTYMGAFTELFGHPAPLPPVVRSPRRPVTFD